MITHIHAATISVKDQDASIEFYTTVLGWNVTMDTQMGPEMRWVTLSPPGAQTNIALLPISVHGPIKDDTGISLETDDIESDFARLTAAGVKFSSAPELMPWGDKGVHFWDPDGNQFYLNGPAK